MQSKDGFVLGEYSTRAAEHGNKVVREMLGRDAKEGECHSVCVAIWVDGRLQFAGADCRPHNGRDVSRFEARQVGTVIAQRMNPNGMCAKEAHFDKECERNDRSVEAICADLHQLAECQRLSMDKEQFVFGKPASVFFGEVADEFERSHRRELEQALRSAKKGGVL